MKPILFVLALIGLAKARPQFNQFQPSLQGRFQRQFQPFRQPSLPQQFRPQPSPRQPFRPSLPQPQQQFRQQQLNQPLAYILRYDADLGLPTGFSYAVQTSDGFNNAVIGEVRNADTSSPDSEEGSLAVEGQYSYVGDDGKTYAVHYTADENGFQPSGEHIPPAASTKKKLGIPSAALASLAGGGLG